MAAENVADDTPKATISTEIAAEEATLLKHTPLDSSFPVLLPYNESLFLPEDQFQDYVRKIVTDARNPNLTEFKDQTTGIEAAEVERAKLKRHASGEIDSSPAKKAAFVEGSEKHEAHFRTEDDLAAENKSFTENADVTNISSKNPLIDLFYDLDEKTESGGLKKLLDNAWKEDPLMTLKIIFNARSIHLGKSNRVVVYKTMGWLAENHPLTLLSNLKWLVRPVIDKKHAIPVERDKKEEDRVKNKEKGVKDEDKDSGMIDAGEVTFADASKIHDVRLGVSHGYWKDLLNLVMFAAHDQLKLDGNPQSLLTQKQDKQSHPKRKRVWDQEVAKQLRHGKREEHHKIVVEKLQHDGFYLALHLTVARLFAQQLKEDREKLLSDKDPNLKRLSLAAKWMPSHGQSHDKNTFILSTIAEILYPNPDTTSEGSTPIVGSTNRELYLRQARELYRKNYGSPLRKALSVVEREIAANKFEAINYECVPSLAIDRYSALFIRKDYEHFLRHVKEVATSNAKTSVTTLLPSTLIKKALAIPDIIDTTETTATSATKFSRISTIKAAAVAQATRDVIDGQWRTLVQRVKDSGVLHSCIAVCDVGGSMTKNPKFEDGTTPMDSAIGLSLLVSEVTTSPPFGGGFITFSASPTYVSLGGPQDHRGLVEKAQTTRKATWSKSTDFVAVFEDVILPMAIRNQLRLEDMVKQVFVFTDMLFDQAQDGVDRWMECLSRISQVYAAAGYDVPKLIFWNLAVRRAGKLVTVVDESTVLVEGYSQRILKVFLESGGFEEEVVDEVVGGGDGDAMVEVQLRRKKIDPMTLVRKAVEHRAFAMLEVVD
jgi:hypothetical protein